MKRHNYTHYDLDGMLWRFDGSRPISKLADEVMGGVLNKRNKTNKREKDRQMNQVTVKRVELLEKLKVNRNNHRDQFLKAQDGYRKAVVSELDKMLSDARDGKKIRRAISLPEPQDRTEDYDCAIAMLEMSVEDTITITSHEFAQFVQDRWSWSDQVTACNASYIR